MAGTSVEQSPNLSAQRVIDYHRKRKLDDDATRELKRPRQWYYRLESESSIPSEEDTESVYSIQDKETDIARDTSDTDTKSEGSSDFTDFEVEYDVASLSEHDDYPILDHSSSGTDDLLEGAIAAAICETSLEAWATDNETSDTSSMDDVDFGRTKFGKCVQCKSPNDNPRYRYCEKCYQVRKMMFPPRPRARSRRRCTERKNAQVKLDTLRSCLSGLSQDSGCALSQDSGLGSSQELQALDFKQIVVPNHLKSSEDSTSMIPVNGESFEEVDELKKEDELKKDHLKKGDELKKDHLKKGDELKKDHLKKGDELKKDQLKDELKKDQLKDELKKEDEQKKGVNGLQKDANDLKNVINGLKIEVNSLKEEEYVLKKEVKCLKKEEYVLKSELNGLKHNDNLYLPSTSRGTKRSRSQEISRNDGMKQKLNDIYESSGSLTSFCDETSTAKRQKLHNLRNSDSESLHRSYKDESDEEYKIKLNGKLSAEKTSDIRKSDMELDKEKQVMENLDTEKSSKEKSGKEMSSFSSDDGRVLSQTDRELSAGMTESKEVCIMCNIYPKNSIFLHGSIAHMCCCYKCAKKTWRTSKRCPVCNCKVRNVVKVFTI